MADISHELGSLRHVVDSPLSSKVAMFNNHAQKHKDSQLLNPFSETCTQNGRASPKPSFSKDEYGKPLAGSLTEMRGQKANMHVLKEMLELCQIIDTEGYNVKDEPEMRVIPFGELFNIYNFISDKVVGILLRARKYKYVQFEGEMLFQRRDDNVPVFLLRPVQSIRREIEQKINDIKRATSPAPQSTSLLLDKSAHQQKLQEAGLVAPKVTSKSRTPSPTRQKVSKPTQTAQNNEKEPLTNESNEAVAAKKEEKLETISPSTADNDGNSSKEDLPKTIEKPEGNLPLETEVGVQSSAEEIKVESEETNTTSSGIDGTQSDTQVAEPNVTTKEKIDINNNANDEMKQSTQIIDNLPTIIVEVTAEYHGTNSTDDLPPLEALKSSEPEQTTTTATISNQTGSNDSDSNECASVSEGDVIE